jgi:hypothetical protein
VKAEEKPVEIEAENMLALAGDDPLAVLKDEEKRAALYTEIRKQISLQKPDLSTQAGRDRVKSFVFKITRTRTAIEAAGKKSTADMRAVIDAVNKLRSDTGDAFLLLEVEARKPLTDWELAEEKAATDRKAILQQMSRAVAAEMAAPDLKDLQIEIEGLQLDPALWGDDLDMVTARQAEVVSMLDAKIVAAEAQQRAAIAEAETARLLAAQPAAQADPNPPAVEPVFEQQELPPPITGNGSPAAAAAAKPLTPTQKARRLVLPALIELGIAEETARSLILAIEQSKLPGIYAAYLELNT